MNIVVVTASIGERSAPYTPAQNALDSGVRYVAFCDRKITHPVWECVQVKQQLADPCRDAKRYKILIDQFVDADATLWVDWHCRLTASPLAIFNSFEESLGLIKHHQRDVYHEARACRRRKKDDVSLIDKTIDRLRLEGWPRRSGVWCGGLIARRHCEEVSRFNRLWWHYVECSSRRDQLTLPVAIERSGVDFKSIANLQTQNLIRIFTH